MKTKNLYGTNPHEYGSDLAAEWIVFKRNLLECEKILLEINTKKIKQ